jgi:hypothetical protein
MRMMLTAQFPHEPFNTLVKEQGRRNHRQDPRGAQARGAYYGAARRALCGAHYRHHGCVRIPTFAEPFFSTSTPIPASAPS